MRRFDLHSAEVRRFVRHGLIVVATALAASACSPAALPSIGTLPAGSIQTPSPHPPLPNDVISQADELAKAAARDLQNGDYDSASASINKALQLRIDRSYYHLLNGLAYHLKAKQGDHGAFDLAEQGYELAIHFDESNWLGYYFRGRLKIDTGRHSQAMTDLADALMLQPDDQEILGAFAFAAYRSHRPDLAAGALSRVLTSDRPVPVSMLRNAAMVMATLGRFADAEEFIAKYASAGASSRDVAYLRRRVQAWTELHQSRGITLAQYYGGGPRADAPLMPMGVTGQSGLESVPPEDRKTAAGTEDKMVVVDVIMVSTEESISTSKGVNLLSGLSIEFGGGAGGSALPAYGFTKESGSSSSKPGSTITKAITVPAVTYTLNILNAFSQRSEVLSRPTLVGLAGKQSQFFSGLELNAAAVAGGGAATAGGISIGGGQAINIQKEIGVRLSVVPTILEDGRLRLAVNVERTFLLAPSSSINFTFKLETSKDQINANVIMNYGETLILGGLSEKETQYSRDGVPFVQDIPLLQYFFSNESKSDYQKSILVLLTPRPPQNVYQPDTAREKYDKSLSEYERPIANLQARYSDWFKPYPNWASVFRHLQDNGLYREFRTGDVDLESWATMQSLSDRLGQALDFLHY